MSGLTYLIHSAASLQTKWNTDDTDYYDLH
jgi:hypothetical protein